MRQGEKKQEGFTLLEMLAVLILVGVISAALGLAIVQGVKAYIFAKENVSLSQKGQLALARMERELEAVTDIDTANSDAACIRYKRETATRYYRAIGLRADNLEMSASSGADRDCPSAGSPGDVLVDNVAGFTLSYEDNTGTTDSTPPADLINLYAVHIDLSLNRADSSRTEVFTLIVNPRNTGVLNAPGSS